MAVELPLVGGGSYTWEYVDFARALDLFAQESADFAGILRDLQQRKPSTPSEPWEIVVYFDETVPGDPLRLDQRRKFMSFYLAVKDVGPRDGKEYGEGREEEAEGREDDREG